MSEIKTYTALEISNLLHLDQIHRNNEFVSIVNVHNLETSNKMLRAFIETLKADIEDYKQLMNGDITSKESAHYKETKDELTAAEAEITELKEIIKREVVPDIKDAEIARLQSALDVAVEGLELVKADSSRPLGEIAGYFYSKETYDEVSSALDKIKQIRK